VTDPNVFPVGGDSPETSLSLLDRVRQQDSAAWDQFVALYTPLVERWCRQLGLQEADLSDICQEVFLAVAGGIGTFERQPGAGKLRRWLRTITHNKVHDVYRRRNEGQTGAGGSDAYEQLLQVPADQEDSAASQAEEARTLYRRAVDLMARDFAESTWKAFWRTVVDDQPAAAVADELGLSANAVYLARARVLARLRSEFRDLLD
jgi:RNA polymerase sigma-70 factor (ECF subfamily)